MTAPIFYVGLLLVLAVGLMGCGSQITDVPTVGRTITTSTELIPVPEGSSPVFTLMQDAGAIGIEIYEVTGKGPAPGELDLKAHVAPSQATAAYQTMADRLLAITEKYKQALYFDRLHVLLVSNTGEVLYEHSFQLAPPSSTTSTAKQFMIYYSSPGLDVSPRPGVTLKVTISQYSSGAASGAVHATVDIGNESGSAFRFFSEDLQLYVDGSRVEQTNPRAKPIEVTGGITTFIYFNPSKFDPASCGLVYTSSDPESKGFTRSDGQTQAQSKK